MIWVCIIQCITNQLPADNCILWVILKRCEVHWLKPMGWHDGPSMLMKHLWIGTPGCRNKWKALDLVSSAASSVSINNLQTKTVLYQIIVNTDLNVLTLDIPFWPGSSMCKITIMWKFCNRHIKQGTTCCTAAVTVKPKSTNFGFGASSVTLSLRAVNPYTE